MDDLPIFELCAVMKEVDLFHEWVPFCKESVMVDRIGRAELIPYVWLAMPLMGRDFAFKAYAADCMNEHGRIIISGKYIEEYPEKPIPFKKSGWLQDKMRIIELKNIINVINPKSAQNIFIIHVDPNTRLPQTIINFVMRNLAGVLLYLFTKQAIKASKDPNCSHAQRIREDTEFYRDWLLPKLRAYCDLKGWEQPVIESLGPYGIPEPKSNSSSQK
mmetsp:Transcript_26097/g.28462  ORF Transcript_26097/g.28462 Transcript_26097/m.28462 type:complete len:217 (-) Transcript_26097:152-802(-)